jgi:hypothetical protein
MEEVVGSIPTRSTNPFNQLERNSGTDMMCVEHRMFNVGLRLCIAVEQEVHCTALCNALFSIARTRLDLHRCGQTGMPHQFLH